MKDGSADLVSAVVGAVAEIAPNGAALHEPMIDGNELSYVKECIETGWVSSVGSYVDRFENMLSTITGAEHAVAVMNGTAALHVCLVLAGVEHGDEVIVPGLTFIAPANAAVHCGAVPHFADIEASTLGLDPAKLDQHLNEITEVRDGLCINTSTGRTIRAVVCVHVFGHSADLDNLVEVCNRHHLVLIEDSAESLGSFYKGTHTGNHGQLAALSFNGNKIVTTGGGGAILVKDAELARRAKHLTTTAKLPHPWKYEHDFAGFNYRMPNLNAAMGCAQLERLEEFVDAKRQLSSSYRERLAGIDGISVIAEPADCRSNYWLNAIILAPDQADLRDAMLQALHDAGLLARPAWEPLHRLPMYEACPRMDLSVTEDLARRIICLPSGVGVGGAANG